MAASITASFHKQGCLSCKCEKISSYALGSKQQHLLLVFLSLVSRLDLSRSSSRTPHTHTVDLEYSTSLQ
ncbi:hypothetical protein PsYK624_073780 [Phanerochaete sordida]|uniref:Uncharacterized protein n=1 Tax=Phanerochaete sordida TaxID=48140 RepID=A0A9P3GBB7_9APHY|nr:hypothetical protein PsYK624_073780 [Phanerochaete sordida]